MNPDSAILIGDAREQLATLPEASVHCCVTSPPYWSLRDYGVAGQIGLEATPEEYIETMVDVFRAVRRVLRPDGTLWLNLGDSYCNAGSRNQGTGLDGKRRGGVKDTDGTWADSKASYGDIRHKLRHLGIKHKDLLGIPWRVALALQADGWWLRSGMPWVKRNPMPESCTDRPTSALEYVFLLTPSPRYYFDMEAVRTKLARPPHPPDWATSMSDRNDRQVDNEANFRDWGTEAGRAFRNTDLYYASLKEPHGLICVGDEPVGLDVVSEAFKDAHFATFPRRLVEPMIKAGTSEKGCCPECGAPWVRVIDKDRKATRPAETSKYAHLKTYLRPGRTVEGKHGRSTLSAIVGNRDSKRHVTETRTVGWRKNCKCKMPRDPLPMTQPCTVLDVFDGAGTTRLVARQLGRRGIGIELNPEYARMAEKRIADPEPLPEIPDVDGQLTFKEM